MSCEEIRFSAVPGMPDVGSGDCIASLVVCALKKADISLLPGDILVIAQKVVSKSLGLTISLDTVAPSPFAAAAALTVDKDPSLVEIILRQSRSIIRMGKKAPGKGRLIVETPSGMIMANAGVDMSNTGGARAVTLLPPDCDASARRILSKVREKTGTEIAVIISDTVGRPWREGLVDIAIGCAGIKPLKDYRGEKDIYGIEICATEMAVVDQIAAGAGMLMKKRSSYPVVHVRGADFDTRPSGSRALLRDPLEDLFR